VAAVDLRAIPDVVVPVFLGIVLSITVHAAPVAARHGLPGWVGTVLSLVPVFGIVAPLFVLVVSGSSWPACLRTTRPTWHLSCRRRSWAGSVLRLPRPPSSADVYRVRRDGHDGSAASVVGGGLRHLS
jgi:hypothetical protein